MARAKLRLVVQDPSGNVLSGAAVYLYTPNTTTLIPTTIYQDKTGGGTLSNPLTANAKGVVEAYIDIAQTVDAVPVKAGYDLETIPDEAFMPDPADISLVGHTHSGMATETYVNTQIAGVVKETGNWTAQGGTFTVPDASPPDGSGRWVRASADVAGSFNRFVSIRFGTTDAERYFVQDMGISPPRLYLDRVPTNLGAGQTGYLNRGHYVDIQDGWGYNVFKITEGGDVLIGRCVGVPENPVHQEPGGTNYFPADFYYRASTSRIFMRSLMVQEIGDPPDIEFNRAQGVYPDGTPVGVGAEVIARLRFRGWHSGGGWGQPVAQLYVASTGTQTSTSNPGEMIVYTTPSGTVTAQPRQKWADSGQWYVYRLDGSAQRQFLELTNSDQLNIGNDSGIAEINLARIVRLGGAAISTSAGSGGASALPGNPAGYATVIIDGATRKIAYYQP